MMMPLKRETVVLEVQISKYEMLIIERVIYDDQ